MRLKIVLPAFALLLAVSTATSFVGYRYLGLASEYRQRNFWHMAETQSLITLLNGAPTTLRPADIDAARRYLGSIQAQAEWCLLVLSDFEQHVFRRIGAAGALDICSQDIALNLSAVKVLDEMTAAYGDPERGKPAFALGLRIRDYAQAILEDSLSFNPYVGVIEEKLKKAVRLGTALAAAGLAIIFAIIARDLTRSQRLQQRQTQDLRELAAIAERANDAIILADPAGKITWINPAFERLTGYALAECQGKRPGDLLQGPDTDPQTRDEIRAALRRNRPVKRDILNYAKDGRSYWVSLSISALEASTGEHFGYVAISSDISKDVAQREAIEAANREIEHQSLHDPLTDLPNRRALDQAMRHRINARLPTTLVRIDLDHFKFVNDTLGHDAGDFVLQQIGDILREETSADDLPARVGGDEFVVLLAPADTSEQGRVLAERILARIKRPMQFEGKLVRVGASFGVASTLDDLLSIEELIVGADAALYGAKECGRNRVHLYTPELHTELAARRSMARELKKAVTDEEFVPYFQPQIDARTRALVGVETLARWQSSTLGLVMPDDFLPVARRLSIVEEIDDIVFRKAVQQICALRDAGIAIDKMSVNVTANRVYDPNVVRMVQNARTGDLKIAFEILESVLVEDQPELFHFGIDALRDAGVSIEIDDFGSGHASIIGLMQLRPDAMKIDRRLVSNIGVQRPNCEIVQNIISIAKSMELTVTAEGVETMEQAELLSNIGCDVLQGFAFAKPMPVAGLKSFALSYRARKTA